MRIGVQMFQVEEGAALMHIVCSISRFVHPSLRLNKTLINADHFSETC